MITDIQKQRVKMIINLLHNECKMAKKYNIQFPPEPTEKDYIKHAEKESGYKHGSYCYHNINLAHADHDDYCENLIYEAQKKRYPRIFAFLGDDYDKIKFYLKNVSSWLYEDGIRPNSYMDKAKNVYMNYFG